ncbi:MULTISPECIES: hypothetical protein [Cyanophyceae]|uniref:hypothetical protein n=1 Tax=Cyanophyceae TaxID=3028117 RepID=UPI0016895DAE|nr:MULTISPECIES: hypothetical protein [Cyanophyceae]MBD1917051.1 hypothetical protein [Phormidium sp. FACHB-77]MBD2030582.1 hypothetical protein [Phormidium sp. FACHB-322]MBD2050310.1 hypothetical protein [Leptolyngbya sp. FACHB-60]
MDDQSLLNESSQSGINLPQLVEAAVQAVTKVGESRDLETALAIRDEIRRLPDELVTEILNQLILRLIFIDPLLCRWFVLDVFLHDADPDAKADVTERINVLMADLRSQQK